MPAVTSTTNPLGVVLGRFGFSLRVTATMADGASPAHTVRVIMAFSKQPLLGGDE